MAASAAFEFYLELLGRVVAARGGDAQAAMAPYASAAGAQGSPGSMVALGSMLTGDSAAGGAPSDIVPVPAGLGVPRPQ